MQKNEQEAITVLRVELNNETGVENTRDNEFVTEVCVKFTSYML